MFSGFIDNLVGLSILLRHDGIKENHSLAALRISRYSSDKTPNWGVLLPFSDKIKKTLPIIFVLYYNYLFFLRRVSFIICFRTTLLFKTKNAPKVFGVHVICLINSKIYYLKINRCFYFKLIGDVYFIFYRRI